MNAVVLLLLVGCLVDRELYDRRRAEILAAESNQSHDSDADGTNVIIDSDGDGYEQYEDCNDQDRTVHPGAPELCNGIDDDCDDEVDEGLDFETWYLDADADGFGDDDTSVETCMPVEGMQPIAGDCDDSDPAVYPGADDIIDGIDNDCDTMIDVGELDDMGESWTATVAHGLAGSALAIGDADGNGDSDLLVGAPGDETYPDNHPAIYLISDDFSGGGQLGDADLIVSDDDPESRFGASVAIVEGVGVLVGAPGASVSGDGGGAAYLFASVIGSHGVGNAVGTITTDNRDHSSMGAKVGVVGDWDGDGVVDVFVSDYSMRADGVVSAGVVYVVSVATADGVASDVSTVAINGTVEQGHFGYSVGGNADVDGDGYSDLVVGAPDVDDDTASSVGAAYLFLGGHNGDIAQAEAVASITGTTDFGHVGVGVRMFDDLDDDGRAEFAVGAGLANERPGGDVVVFQGRREGVLVAEQADWVVGANQPGQQLGEALGGSVDCATVAFGWPSAGRDEPGVGGVAVVEAWDGTFREATTTNQFYYGRWENERMGAAVFMHHDVMVVGAPGYSQSASLAGRIVVVTGVHVGHR